MVLQIIIKLKNKKKLLAVGFEPTRANTEHLKCSPLDQLGHVSDSNILGTRQFSIGNQPTLSRAATGIEPASGHK